MTLGIVTVRGGLTLPGMVPAGDSAGAGVASMQAGAVLGTAAIGAAVTGEVAAIGDTITTIIQVIIALTITVVLQLGATEVMLVLAEPLKADILVPGVIVHQVRELLP